MSDRNPRSDGLQTRQELIEALQRLRLEGKYPTARELAAATGWTHSAVRYHLAAMQADGLISLRERPSQVMRHEIILTDLGNDSSAQP